MAKPETTGETMAEVKGWAIATNFAFTVAGGVLLGWLLEHYLWPKATPWIMLAGAGVGLFGGFTRFVKEATAVNREAGKKR